MSIESTVEEFKMHADRFPETIKTLQLKWRVNNGTNI